MVQEATEKLIREASNGHSREIKALLDMTEVDVNSTDDEGRTAVWVAAAGGHLSTVQVLFKRDGDPSITPRTGQYQGKTAIDIAHIKNKKDVVDYLRRMTGLVVDVEEQPQVCCLHLVSSFGLLGSFLGCLGAFLFVGP